MRPSALGAKRTAARSGESNGAAQAFNGKDHDSRPIRARDDAPLGLLVTAPRLDLDQLLKLRLVVARFGEMDLAKWWNTKGQLGRLGAAALRRGFPRTHYFAQARSVFAVAAHRCADHFDAPKSVTLWHLTEEIEEEFDARWEHWLDQAASFTPFFEKLAAAQGMDLRALLRAFEIVSERQVEASSRLRRSAETRAVLLPGVFAATDDEVAQLALGFACGEETKLAVPYARMGDA